MAKPKRGARRRSGGSAPQGHPEAAASGTGGFLRTIGTFETINGLPHGPVAIAGAIVLAVLLYPITRLVRLVARR